MAYATQSTLNSMFGSGNINLWGSPNGSESAGDVTTRCTLFVTYADAFINGRIIAAGKHSNKVPFTSTPTIIEFISTQMAGGMMYEAWGIRDTEPKKEGEGQLAYHVKRAWDLLEQVAQGQLDIGV